MVRVTVELDPKGLGKNKRLIGLLLIANVGGNAVYGDYEWALSHAGKYLGKRREPYKSGRVLRFKRSLSPYRLIYRCLKDAKEV